jgi:hypothetical protein
MQNAERIAEIVGYKAKARGQVMTTLYKTLYVDDLMNGNSDLGLDPADIERFLKLMETKREQKALKEAEKAGPAVMVTINPPDSAMADDPSASNLLVDCRCVSRWNWVSNMSYCIETRGETGVNHLGPNFKGIHVHMFFLRGTYEPSRVKSQITQRFQRYFPGTVISPHLINIRFFKEEDIPNGVRYIQGYKGGKLKKNWKSDSRFRNCYEYPRYYSGPNFDKEVNPPLNFSQDDGEE